MRGSLFLVLILAIAIFAFIWWFLRTPPEQVAKYLRLGAIGAAIALFILLAITGRLHWIFAIVGAAVAFVLRLVRLMPALPLPLLHRLFSGWFSGRANRNPSPGQTTSVETRYLRMQLNHDTGEMDGEIVEGRYAGKRLSDLDLSDLLLLLDECRDDEQSLNVLQAYLDRMHPDWQEQAEEQGADSGHTAGNTSGPMSEGDALDILGLEPGATRDEIIAAHRRLMQKVHPDRGGSDYLAAEINAAKDLLLKTKH